MTQRSQFARYLEAKRRLDDRSLNTRVWNALATELEPPMDILDVGCGLGGTLDRLLSADLIRPGGGKTASYTGVDRDPHLITLARGGINEISDRHGLRVELPAAPHAATRLTDGERRIDVRFESADVFDFARVASGRHTWSLITAHAFLDLLDLDGVLDALLPLVRPGGLAYFSLNFDDLTAIEPPVDPALDDAVLAAYHSTMYAERWGGGGGERRSGRRLFHALTSRGVTVLEMGPSDWVIAPLRGEYRDDDRFVLQFLLEHIGNVVGGSGSIPAPQLARWLENRRRQIAESELVYLAHQLDILGKRKG